MPSPAESFLRTALRASALTLLLVALIAVWAWRLYPGPAPVDPSLAARTRTLTTLTSFVAQAPESIRLPAITALAWLPDETLQALHEWRYESAERQVRLLTVQKGPVDSGPLHAGLLFSALKTANWASLEGAHLMISASGERLPDTLKIDALRLLSTKALKARKAESAMEILQRAIRVAPDDWDLLHEAIGICRQAFRPDLALKLLKERMEDSHHPLAKTEMEQALDLEMALLIRAGRGKEALTLAEERLKSRPHHSPTVERVATAASFAGLPKRALPALNRFLASHDLHQLSPKELLEASATNDRTAYLRILELHARLSDEAGDARRSQDSLLRITALGDMRYVGRLEQLSANSPSDKTWDALKASLPDPFDAARKALKAGHAEVAQDLLARVLRSEPTHRDAAYLQTQIQVNATEDASAHARLWDQFSRSHPSDAEGLRQLAQAHESAGQSALALRTLNALPFGEHDAASLQQLQQLALHQGEMSTALATQKALLERREKDSPADFIRLARFQQLGSENATSTEALLAGLDRFPDNTLLRETLNRDAQVEIRPAKAVFAAEAE